MKRVLSAALMLMIFSGILFAQTDMPEAKGTVDANFGKLPDDFGKRNLNPNPKIACALQQVIDNLQKQPELYKSALKKMRSGINGMKTTGGIGINAKNEIAVEIQLPDLNKSTLDKLAAAGVDTKWTEPRRNVLYTYLSRDKIYELSTLQEIKFIRLPPAIKVNTGSVTTLADEYLRTREVRQIFNYDGSGVTIGVISDGMQYADQSASSGDLPVYPGYPCIQPPANYYPGTGIKYKVLGDGADINQGAEGTAMMEIIHDLAPKATLVFATFDFSNVASFNEAKRWLATKGPNGGNCDIICDDIGVLGDGNFDGTSPTSLTNSEIVRQGVLYYTSVGNEAQTHYGGYFTDAPKPLSNRIHNFIYEPAAGRYDETLEVKIPSGGIAIFWLTWYEPFGYASDDIDLYILNSQTLDINNPIAYSTDIQAGDGNPVEVTGVINTGDDAIVSVVIMRKKVDLTPRRLDLFIWGNAQMLEYITPESSITNNSDAGGGVMSIGAINVNSPRRLTVEPFSSRGPTLDGRIKPEMANYDGVVTTVPGFEAFYGTSAASPHAAGVAALLKQLLPYDTPDQINSYLRFFCDDLAPTGVDNISGSGRMIAYPIFDRLINAGWPNRTCTYTFNINEEGWQSGSAAGFTPPQFSREAGNLVMTATNNVNTFGYWVSPTVRFMQDNSVQLIADKMYEVRCLIGFGPDGIVNPTNFPSFRIRVMSGSYNEIAMKVFNSLGGNGIFPLPGNKYRDYTVHFRPDQASITSGVQIAIDLMNFDQGDLPNAQLFIDEVQIRELNLPY